MHFTHAYLSYQLCFLLHVGAVLKLQYDSGFRLGAIESMLSDIYQSPVCIRNAVHQFSDIKLEMWAMPNVMVALCNRADHYIFAL